MIKFKAILAGILSACLLFAVGCDTDNSRTSDESQDMLHQETALLFNEAVRQLNEAQSYTMTGSVNSTAVIGEVTSNVVTSIDCVYEKGTDGGVRMLMNSAQRYDGMVFEHSTYFADGKYYITAIDSSYIVDTNDFGDYGAAMYAMPVEDTALSNVELRVGADGTGHQIRFEIPYGIYASEALAGLLGDMVDDTVLQQLATIRANINDSGQLTSLYISVENSTMLGEELIEQAVIVSLTIDGWNTTTVAAPENLEDYEDRTAKETIDGGFDYPDNITGDDFN